jgi:hypothetical protein
MGFLKATDLAAMRAVAEASMGDTCRILVYDDTTVNAYGKVTPAWIESLVDVRCGFNATAQRETMDGSQVAITDAVLRLPLGTVLSHLDHVKITKQQGETLTPAPEFAVIGEPRQGATALVVNLRRVKAKG